jgi:cytochrome c oxidase subunit 2
MTTPRRSGPSPAVWLLIAAVLSVGAFLGILAISGINGPTGSPDIVAQLGVVWASFFPPAPSTTQGGEIHDLYTLVFIVAAAIFLLVEGLIVWAVVRYRRRPDQTELPPQTHGNNTLEVIWTVVPTAIVAILFFLSWQTLNSVDASKAEAGEVRIRAVAARFQWSFEYISPDDNSTVLFTQIAPEMVVPAGRTVHLALRSPDVNHAFYVPQFLFKRDVIPGKENVFDFKVEEAFAGQTFRGQCAELCGAQHWAMQFTVKALTPAEFDAWLADQVANAQETPAPAPSGAPEGAVIELTAQNIEFDKTAIEAPADAEFTIRFKNDDPAVTHNVEIKDAAGTTVFFGEIFQGVDSRDYRVPALAAGTYQFICTVHPNMAGTLTVK